MQPSSSVDEHVGFRFLQLPINPQPEHNTTCRHGLHIRRRTLSRSKTVIDNCVL